MKTTRHWPRLAAPVTFSLVAALASATLGLGPTGAIAAEPVAGSTVPTEAAARDTTAISTATIEFGFNDVQQGAAPAGGCNFFVAGKTQGLSSDYKSIDGDVYVVKKHADGSTELVGVNTRCSPATGSAKINQRFLFTNGTGQTAADGSTSIHWTGAGTINAYGGLVSWYFEDPVLELNATGNGTITARAGGFGSSMADPNVKVPLAPRDGVEIATVRGASIVDGQLSIDPVYPGVDYFPLTDPVDQNSPRTTVSAIPDAAKANNASWGSWPESFVDFQYATGLSSYWHSSGLSADPNKPPLPIDVVINGSAPDYSLIFVQEPADTVLSAGDDVTLTARAISKNGTPALHWQVKRAGGEWADLEGETGNDLVLKAVSVSDWNGTALRAIASLDGDSIATNPATLSVTQPAAPTFTTQPESKTAGVDGSAYFEVAAVGYPTPTVLWQRKAADGSWNNVPGAVYPWFSYYPVVQADQGAVFRALATNSNGSTQSQEVTLTVTTSAATITYQPRNTAAFIGGNGYIGVGVEGAPRPTIVWERSADGSAWETIPNSNRDLLTFSPVAPDDGNFSYRARVSNGLGDEEVSAAARITVVEQATPPVFAFPAQNLDPTVENTVEYTFGKLPDIPAGRQGEFRWGIIAQSVWQPGNAPVDIDAFLSGTPAGLGDWSWYTGGSTIPANSFDPRQHYGFAFFFAPTDGKPNLPQFDMFVPITLGEAPTITTQPTSTTVPVGTTGVFTVVATGTPAPSYQWQKKTGDGWVDLAGAHSAELSVPTTVMDSAAGYRVVVTNGIGAAAVSAEATLVVTPKIGGQPGTTAVPQPGSAGAAANSQSAALANTGFESTILGSVAALLVLAGGLIVTQRRRLMRLSNRR